MPFRNIMPPPPKPSIEVAKESEEYAYGERIMIDGMRVPEIKEYEVGDEFTMEARVTLKEIEERQDKNKYRLEYRIQFKEVAIPSKKKIKVKEQGSILSHGVPQ